MLHILGMGCCHPTNVIDNQFLVDLDIESSAEWIVAKIGIHERKTVLPLDYIKETKNKDTRAALELVEMTPTEMGAKAARIALEKAGVKAEDVGLVICNCCTPMQSAPAESQRIAYELGIQSVAYDVFTACPAFALHVDHLSKFKEEELPDYILCVSTAMLTQRVDYTDRSASAIWGDGAAAWVISPKQKGKLKVVATSFDADPSRCHAVVVETFSHFHQDGRAVRDFSVRQTVRMIRALEKENELDWNRDIFIGHQAMRPCLSR